MTNLILTSYYAKAANFDPEKYALISIAGGTPTGWKYQVYKKVAPSWSIWNEWHNAMEAAKQSPCRQLDEDLACKIYTRRYNSEILGKLNPQDVLRDIESMSKGKTPVLFCYETSEKFCHRHLVADWLLKYSNAMLDNDAGYDNDLIVREWDEPKSKPTKCINCENSILHNGEWRCGNINRITSDLKTIVSESIDAYADWTKGERRSKEIEQRMQNLIDFAAKTLDLAAKTLANIKEYKATLDYTKTGAINVIDGQTCGYHIFNATPPA